MPTNDPGASPNAFESGKPGTAGRSRAEAVIEQLRRRGGIFVDAVRATRMPMALTDPNLPGNPIVFANHSFLQLCGYGMDEVLGQQPFFMNGPDTDPKDAARFRQALEEDRDGLIESVQYRKDGSRFVAAVLLSAFKGEDGRTLHHFLSWLDVTRRVDAEDELTGLRQAHGELREREVWLAGQNEAFRAAVNGAPLEESLGILIATARRQIPEAAHCAIHIAGGTGNGPGQVVGTPPDDAAAAESFRIPVETAGRAPVGTLVVHFGQSRAPTDTELAIAASLAGTASIIIAQHQTQSRLRLSEGRLRDVLDSMGEGFALLGPDFTIRDVNEETLRLDGRPREQLIGRVNWEAFPGTERSALGELFRRVMHDRTPGSLEYRYLWPDGRDMWVDVNAYPTAGGGIALFWRDVTARKRSQEAVRVSEQRYRALFESMDEACAVVEVLKDDAGEWADFRFIEVNPAFRVHTSIPDPVGRTATELLGSPNPRWAQIYGQALDTGKPLRIEESEPTLERVFDLNVFSLDRARNRVAVLFTNVTQRKRAEARQKMLLSELQHRVRNILATIRSVARRTGETARTVEDHVQHLEGRISAMARTQVLLTRDLDAGVDLAGLILDELETQAAQPGQYDVRGPDVALSPRAAEVLGLAVHELATNAVKYGALSVRSGRVDVSWALLDRLPEPRLRLLWSESGVSIDAQPHRRGFGTELITRRVPYELHGKGTVEFRPTGLLASIELPLTDLPSILQTDAVENRELPGTDA